MDNLAKALSILAKSTLETNTLELLLGYSMAMIKPDLAAYYKISENNSSYLELVRSKGCISPAKKINKNRGINFVLESGESLAVLNTETMDSVIPYTEADFFPSIILDPSMKGGICTPAVNGRGTGGLVFLNFTLPYQFNFDHIKILETLVYPITYKGDC